MQIFYDLTLDKLVTSPGTTSELTALEFKRAPYQLIELQFGRSPSVFSQSVLDGGADNWTEVGFLTFTGDASTDKLTFTSVADLENDFRVRVVSTSALPGNLTVDTNYYVINLDKTAKTCQLATTKGGAAVDVTSAGTGTHTLIFWPEITIGIKADGVFDGDFLAVVQTFSADVNTQFYKAYLSLETQQIETLLGHEEPGDGTTFTVDAGTDVVTLTDTGELSVGDRVRLTTTDTLPAPLAIDTDYYWIAADKFSATSGGAAIDLTDAGTGTHTATRQPDNTNDLDEITGAMFEVSFRNDPSLNQWRPSINQVAATILHNVNDPDTNQPIDTAASSEGQALLVSGANAGAAMQELKGLNFTDATLLTIATGAITVTQSHHRVDTESAAASDDLDTISGGNTGDVLFLSPENAARVTTIKHGTGNINSPFGTDTALNATLQFIKTVAGDWDLVATTTSNIAVIDDDTFATASSSNVPSAESVKAYVDANDLSLIDEDSFATDSATRPPSQQSTKAYVTTQIAAIPSVSDSFGYIDFPIDQSAASSGSPTVVVSHVRGAYVSFDSDELESVNVGLTLPEWATSAGTIKARIVWGTTATVGTAILGVNNGTPASEGQIPGAVTRSATYEVTDTSDGTAGNRYYTSAITLQNTAEPGEQMYFSLWRGGGTLSTQEVSVYGVQIEIPRSQISSGW
jgi:hypothetical protein